MRELGLNERQQTQFNRGSRLFGGDPALAGGAGAPYAELRSGRLSGTPAQIDDAPLFLLIEGDPQALLRPQLAMVGSRQFSHYGERWANYFAEELARCGFTITSGLAIGIDGICHRAALAAGVAR